MTTVYAATHLRRALAAEEIRRQVARLMRRGASSTRNMLASLLRAQRDIVDQLQRGGTAFDAFRGEQLSRAIEIEIRRLRLRLQIEFASSLRFAARQGVEDVQAQVEVILGSDAPALIGVDPLVIRFADLNTSELVGKLSQDLRARLSVAVRSSAIGSETTEDVRRQIGDVVRQANRDPGIFGAIAAQIDRIHRTEVARVYESAKTVRERQVERSSPFEMFSRWISTIDKRTRIEHRQINGATIPVGDNFNFGAGPTWSKVSYEEAWRSKGTLGTRVNGPHAANLGAKDVVNCRCTKSLVKGKRKANR